MRRANTPLRSEVLQDQEGEQSIYKKERHMIVLRKQGDQRSCTLGHKVHVFRPMCWWRG